MKNSAAKSTKEEIKQKLINLYSESLDSGRNVLDFDKKYDFFSMNESVVLKYSSNWFRPEKYNTCIPSGHPIRYFQSLCYDEGGSQKSKQEMKIEKAIHCSNYTRDLEILGRTPYQIGVDGEKFRVVAATLQKCNPPFVRRTFHFTSNGIVEASEKKEDSGSVSANPMPIFKQSNTNAPQPKFVRIRRFRVIKKEDLALEKYVLPQKIKISNGEKTKFLTVKIRSKNSGAETEPSRINAEGCRTEIGTTFEKKTESLITNASSAVQTEHSREAEHRDTNECESDISVINLDSTEEDLEVKMDEVRRVKSDEIDRENEMRETFNCENCGKEFPTYLTCLAHVRSHQRQTCQICTKRFLTAKMLRDHLRLHHHAETARSNAPEDRITTATSKFGRTRQVLNVAGLRSKYRML